MLKNYITFLAAISLVVGCSKVIDIDYKTIDNLYVVAAELTEGDGVVLLTKSSNMDEPAQSTPLTSALVWIESCDGDLVSLEADHDGIYRTTSQMDMVAGYDYTLSVDIDGQCFSSTSHLYAEPSVGNVSFSMQQFTPQMNLIFCTFNIFDVAGEDNYYRYRFRYFGNEVDGEVPGWTLAKEEVDGESISLMTHLYSKDRDLEDGDQITIEVQAIDRATYDFLYSLGLSGNSSSNPTSNFEGGCLGYFSAYSLTTISTQFYYADVVE